MTDAVPGLERVREAASARSLDIEIRERPVAKSLHEAAEILGIERCTLYAKLKSLSLQPPSKAGADDDETKEEELQ